MKTASKAQLQAVAALETSATSPLPDGLHGLLQTIGTSQLGVSGGCVCVCVCVFGWLIFVVARRLNCCSIGDSLLTLFGQTGVSERRVSGLGFDVSGIGKCKQVVIAVPLATKPYLEDHGT